MSVNIPPGHCAACGRFKAPRRESIRETGPGQWTLFCHCLACGASYGRPLAQGRRARAAAGVPYKD